ncbi:phosphatidylinositol alpha-mannosyltransferase [Salinisphaera orenii MK-B5]|uniref:Phosphatidylinositol alpha-mannosyltransferase n=1 Tax=Salinisphaera orenii MK-B5 TaxID=856730 RepID=A0A423PJP4_9GAMM|nr:phosphatidylinositol alpha-mannosyltransferase [Salinisphaera orenii MK-B5]
MIQFRRDVGIDYDAFVIGLAARAHPMKDHDNFLRAAASFVADHPNALFLLAGEGTDDDEIIDRGIAEYGLNKAVVRCGRLENTVAFNCALDVACMSSAWGDAFPNVLAEAMACGVPCVTTEVGDAPAIVGDTGIVVPPREPGALVRGWAQLAELGSAGRAALGARARERVAQRYALQRSTQRYIELLDYVQSSARLS